MVTGMKDTTMDTTVEFWLLVYSQIQYNMEKISNKLVRKCVSMVENINVFFVMFI
jgi:hypothetical protein